MPVLRCPGQDIRFWKPKDIFSLRCPYCGTEVEFWKDDPSRKCPECQQQVNNPHRDLSCAKWCKFASGCLGVQPDTVIAEAPLIERLIALLTKQFSGQPARMKSARNVCRLAETMMQQEGGEPRLVKAAALLAGALLKPAEREFERAEYKTMLTEVNLDDATAENVCLIVGAVMTAAPCDLPDCNILTECNIVWDAVQFERLALANEAETFSVDPDAVINSIRTQSGKQMTARYCSET